MTGVEITSISTLKKEEVGPGCFIAFRGEWLDIRSAPIVIQSPQEKHSDSIVGVFSGGSWVRESGRWQDAGWGGEATPSATPATWALAKVPPDGGLAVGSGGVMSEYWQ